MSVNNKKNVINIITKISLVRRMLERKFDKKGNIIHNIAALEVEKNIQILFRLIEQDYKNNAQLKGEKWNVFKEYDTLENETLTNAQIIENRCMSIAHKYLSAQSINYINNMYQKYYSQKFGHGYLEKTIL